MEEHRVAVPVRWNRYEQYGCAGDGVGKLRRGSSAVERQQIDHMSADRLRI
jgi:hypothetical protein